MKYFFNLIVVGLFIILISSCKGTFDGELEKGIWRATLKTGSAEEIPFNFEITDSADQKLLDIINGKERFRVNEISTLSDSVIIQMPLFDSEIRAALNNQTLSGQWIKHYADSDEVMQFNAKKGDSCRFFKDKTATNTAISGRWSVTFNTLNNKSSYASVGEFTQENGRVFGTFLTTTGDYRFLEGTVSDQKLYLSCFDGSHAYLFTGKLLNDSTITEGKFYSGLSSIETWTANKNEKAILPDAYSITDLKDGYDQIDFSFPGLDEKKFHFLTKSLRIRSCLFSFLDHGVLIAWMKRRT